MEQRQYIKLQSFRLYCEEEMIDIDEAVAWVCVACAIFLIIMAKEGLL